MREYQNAVSENCSIQSLDEEDKSPKVDLAKNRIEVKRRKYFEKGTDNHFWCHGEVK